MSQRQGRLSRIDLKSELSDRSDVSRGSGALIAYYIIHFRVQPILSPLLSCLDDCVSSGFSDICRHPHPPRDQEKSEAVLPTF